MVPFAGYEMPVQYAGVLDEVRAVRTAAGIFDVSHMGQFSVTGAGALDAVQKLVSNDLTRLSIGQAQYNMLCNNEGGIIDDLVVYRRSENEIYICVNASNRREDYEWMRSHLADGVHLEDQSEATALLALQGPRAEEILCQAADPQTVRKLSYYWATETKVFGHPCYLSRTGYTGEDGFELYVPRDSGAPLWEQLVEIGRKAGLVPAGLGARDTLRVEMGYPLHGHEISPRITPAAAGLNWVVKLERKTPFVGQTALQKEAATGGPTRRLKAFRVEDRRIPRQGYRVCLEDHSVVGEITSGTFSPSLGKPVALGFIERAHAESSRIFIEVREALIPAQLTSLPFVPSHTKKNK
jgi:aminomethyltransferase